MSGVRIALGGPILRNSMKITQNQVIELAKLVEIDDSIDWSDLPLDKDRVYQIVGSQAYELFEQWSSSEEGEAVLLATITKLLVENFVLTLRLSNQ